MEVILWGTWQPGHLVASESWNPKTFLCLSLDHIPGPSLKRHEGSGQISTCLTHTDLAVVCFSLSFPPEYKKKYGEEHGSCQAGIAGFFTEVGVSHVAFISLPFLVFGPFYFVVGLAPGDGISGVLGSVDSGVNLHSVYPESTLNLPSVLSE